VRAASISVDLDSLSHYCRIHGLDDSLLDTGARQLIYTVALPRFLELFSRLSVPFTLFAVGEDLQEPAVQASLRSARSMNGEIGNHSFAHDYALASRTPLAIGSDLARAHRAISEATGTAPSGFRAPGYALSPALYQAIAAQGYRYDSSVFPAVPYYLAKALVMGMLAIRKQPSGAHLDTPRVLLAPARPYWPNPAQPYRRGSGAVLELPIATVPGTRLPFIGTFALAFPSLVVEAAYRSMSHFELFNFELHALDLLDAEDEIPAPLAQRQRDLQVSWSKKKARLEQILRRLREDRELLTLADAASRLAQKVPCSRA
jgi:peptidoglycan/xylan/chitin deacetylase (PgdA/CDA1 family)